MEQGDDVARQVFDTYAKHLACGLCSIINIFQPEVLCVGGGISNQGDVLLSPVRDIISKEDYARDSRRQARVVRASLGNDAGIIGAALVTLHR